MIFFFLGKTAGERERERARSPLKRIEWEVPEPITILQGIRKKNNKKNSAVL